MGKSAEFGHGVSTGRGEESPLDAGIPVPQAPANAPQPTEQAPNFPTPVPTGTPTSAPSPGRPAIRVSGPSDLWRRRQNIRVTPGDIQENPNKQPGGARVHESPSAGNWGVHATHAVGGLTNVLNTGHPGRIHKVVNAAVSAAHRAGGKTLAQAMNIIVNSDEGAARVWENMPEEYRQAVKNPAGNFEADESHPIRQAAQAYYDAHPGRKPVSSKVTVRKVGEEPPEEEEAQQSAASGGGSRTRSVGNGYVLAYLAQHDSSPVGNLIGRALSHHIEGKQTISAHIENQRDASLQRKSDRGQAEARATGTAYTDTAGTVPGVGPHVGEASDRDQDYAVVANAVAKAVHGPGYENHPLRLGSVEETAQRIQDMRALGPLSKGEQKRMMKTHPTTKERIPVTHWGPKFRLKDWGTLDGDTGEFSLNESKLGGTGRNPKRPWSNPGSAEAPTWHQHLKSLRYRVDSAATPAERVQGEMKKADDTAAMRIATREADRRAPLPKTYLEGQFGRADKSKADVATAKATKSRANAQKEADLAEQHEAAGRPDEANAARERSNKWLENAAGHELVAQAHAEDAVELARRQRQRLADRNNPTTKRRMKRFRRSETTGVEPQEGVPLGPDTLEDAHRKSLRWDSDSAPSRGGILGPRIAGHYPEKPAWIRPAPKVGVAGDEGYAAADAEATAAGRGSAREAAAGRVRRVRSIAAIHAATGDRRARNPGLFRLLS